MKTVCEKDKCTGCMACKDICPKEAITIDNSIRAYNAVIDEVKCIKCNACHNVCQVNHSLPLKNPKEWYQGWASENEIRTKSSSGGVATAIERAFVENGAIVCSCSFKDGEFLFDIVDNVNDIDQFAGSKYVKSNPSGCYKKVKNKLIKGESVLFVGLPCQVAAVKNFVGENNCENLYTVDLICHGSPDLKILQSFLSQYDIDLTKIDEISFRTKTSFQLKENCKSVGMPGALDKYSIAFLNSICYTDNCYHCQYAKTERVSDITLGDSWGSDLSDFEQKKGISLVLCQSEKGRLLLKNAKLELFPVNVEKAVESNHQLKEPSKKPEKRDYFVGLLEKGVRFNKAVFLCYPKSCFKQFVKACIIKFKNLNKKES